MAWEQCRPLAAGLKTAKGRNAQVTRGTPPPRPIPVCVCEGGEGRDGRGCYGKQKTSSTLVSRRAAGVVTSRDTGLCA